MESVLFILESFVTKEDEGLLALLLQMAWSLAWANATVAVTWLMEVENRSQASQITFMFFTMLVRL